MQFSGQSAKQCSHQMILAGQSYRQRDHPIDVSWNETWTGTRQKRIARFDGGTGFRGTARSPLVVEAVNHLKVRSCLIDGEVVCCDERGLATFQLLRHRRNEPQAFLYAFDLVELNGADLRREPVEVRKATLASILRKSRPGVRLNDTTAA
jgi:hypothetical protein